MVRAKMESSYSRDCKILIEHKGNPVMMDSKQCMEWQKTHDNCGGCLSELGCSKYVGLLLACMGINPQSKINHIIEAKSAETIRTMPFDFADYGSDDY